MRRVFFLLAVLIVAGVPPATMTGCSVNQQFVTGVDAGCNQSGLLDEYDRYVDADPKLKPETKKIRKDTSAGLRKLIQDAKK